jgi:tetratricopeptide (TPR) repeat protein
MSSNSVFISYRRDASKYLARAVFQDLKLSRGIDVFMDVENIDSGTFDTVILNQIAARPYFLVILTPDTLNRCGETGDWLLREINHAMKLDRIIIPITTPEFSFDDADKYLKPTLAKKLRRFNGIAIIHEYFDAGMDKLCNRFLQPVDLQVTPTPSAEKAAVEEKIQQAVSEPKASEEQLSAQAHYEHGSKSYGERRYDIAIASFTEAIKHNSQYVDAYIYRGLVRYDKGDVEGAIADYNEAIRLNPLDATTYNNRGAARAAKGDNDGAFADYDEAIRLNPNHSTAYVGRGLTRRAKGDKDGAFADYNEAIRLNPQDADAFTSRGNVSYIKGDLGSAIADYNEAIRLNPNHAIAYHNRGLARYAKGNKDSAIGNYDEAIRLNPNYIDAYINRAIVRRAVGDTKGAEADEAMAKRLKGGQ